MVLFTNLVVITGKTEPDSSWRYSLKGTGAVIQVVPKKNYNQILGRKIYPQSRKHCQRLPSKAVKSPLGHQHMEHMSQTYLMIRLWGEQNSVFRLLVVATPHLYDGLQVKINFLQQKHKALIVKAKPVASQPCRAVCFTIFCSKRNKTRVSYKTYHD